MHFGATLRLLRIESGLGLRDLARRVSVSGTYLSRVENGLDPVPTSARLEAIARELGLPPPLLLGLAHRVSPLVVDYVHQVPDAGSLLLEIAYRRLDEQQIAEVRAFLDRRFPVAAAALPAHAAGIVDLLAPERVLLSVTCSEFDDVLDLAAGRLAAATAESVPALAAALKKREREVASTIGGGVAVPCVYVRAATSSAALITLDRPLALDTPDGRALAVVIVLAGPRDAPDRRLRLVHVARLAARGVAERLLEQTSVAQVLELLGRLEGAR